MIVCSNVLLGILYYDLSCSVLLCLLTYSISSSWWHGVHSAGGEGIERGSFPPQNKPQFSPNVRLLNTMMVLTVRLTQAATFFPLPLSLFFPPDDDHPAFILRAMLERKIKIDRRTVVVKLRVA